MTRAASLLMALAIALACAAAPARAQVSRVQAGTLDCDVSGGIGLIIESRRQISCIFSPARPGPFERYVGSITNFGLNIGATSGGVMVWAVYAPTTVRRGALAGVYVGASAEATVGVGLGANVLVGGSDKTIALQPLSVEEQVGLNLAVGVAELRLVPAR